MRWFNATAWYAMYLSRLLLEAGHDTLVLVLPDTLCAQAGARWNLPLRFLPLNTTTPWGLVRLYAQLKSLVREFQPDVVNCHRGESFVLWGLLQRELGSFRLVRTRGDQRLPKADVINRWLHNTVSNAVITTNSRMTRHFCSSLGTPGQNVHEILGGVDISVFFPDQSARQRVRKELGYESADFVVGLLGRFDRVKGQHELIQAVARLRAQGHEQVRLLLLGFDSATSEATVRGWVHEYGLEHVTRITGKRPDIAACLAALDLGVVASLWSETIARAALEIMACGVPLVATRVGVLPDLLDDQALVDPGDVPGLAQSIAAVLANEELRNSLRQSQAQRMAGLTGQDFLAQTLAVYEGL